MNSPFKFLDSYTKEDRDIFFGRERETEELYHKVFESKTLLVYGISGTGKTSLINCGLANKFNDADWQPVNIRRGKDIVKSLLDEFNAINSQDKPQKSKSNQKLVLKLLRSIYLDYFKPIFLIFDQLEEIFIFGSKEEKREFAQIIQGIIDSDLSCRIIFSIREEYLACLTEMEGIIPDIMLNRFRIERMNRQNAIAAIEEPCKKHGITVEEGFATALLDKMLAGGGEIELTYLQVYLDRLFNLAIEENSEKPVFTLELLNRSGSITDLLGDFLNEQVAKMDKPDIANTILKAFVSAKGTKKQLNLNDIKEATRVFLKDIDDEKTRQYIQKFVNLRILRDEDEEGRYELRHDSLAAKIFEKISAEEMELLEVRQFIENAFQNYCKRDILLSPDDFEYIGEREKQLKLSGELQDFVDKSRENIRVKRRTVQRLRIMSAAALVIMLFAIGKFVVDSVNKSTSTTLAYRSISQYKDSELRLITAAEAYDKHQSAISREALLKAFNDMLNTPCDNPVFDSLRNIYAIEYEPAPEEIIYGEHIESENYIFGYTRNYVAVWNDKGKIEHKFNHQKDSILKSKMSADGKWIAVLGADSLLSLFDTEGKKFFDRKIGFNKHNPDQSFFFTADNKIITNHKADLVILDTAGNIEQILKGHNDKISAIALSNNNQFIASASYDTIIKVWYYNNLENEYCFYNTIKGHFEDTIWSLNFARNEFYIIVASAQDIKYGHINDKDFSSIFYYRRLIYYSKKHNYAFAQFSQNDLGMIVKRYEYVDNEPNYFDFGIYLYKSMYLDVKSQAKHEFNYLQFSPCSKYYAYSIGNITFLNDGSSKAPEFGNPLLIESEGDKPFFSSMGDFLYTINGNKINSTFTSIDLIYNKCCNLRVY